jgi:hypothetical protein
MRICWLVDERGRVWPEHDPALPRELGTSRRGPALTDFLVKQMGYVAINERAGLTEIIFDPAGVSTIALTEYFYWAADRTFQTTGCVDARNPCITELFHTPLTLQNHLGRIIEARTPCPDFAELAAETDRTSFTDTWQAATEIFASSIEMPLKLNIIEDLLRGYFLAAEQGVTEQRAPAAESVSALTAFHAYVRQRSLTERSIVPINTRSGNTRSGFTRSGTDAVLIAVNRN